MLIQAFNNIASPLNWTVDVPTPPEAVVTVISPRPFPGPDRAIILFGDFHSADNKQSHPQMVKPLNNYSFIYCNQLKFRLCLQIMC